MPCDCRSPRLRIILAVCVFFFFFSFLFFFFFDVMILRFNVNFIKFLNLSIYQRFLLCFSRGRPNRFILLFFNHYVITMMWWVQLEITDFHLEIGNFNSRYHLTDKVCWEIRKFYVNSSLWLFTSQLKPCQEV